MAELNPGQISFNEWIAKNIAERKQKNDRKGWLDYFLNPFTKPGLGDDEAAALMNQSNEGFELANAGLNNALYGPDGTTGSVGASNITQTPSMLGAGEQGVPATGIRNIHDYMNLPKVFGVDEQISSFPNLKQNLDMVPESFTPSITMGTHPSKSIQEVGADEQMPDASKDISNTQGLGPNYGAHSWHDFATPVESSMGVATQDMLGTGDDDYLSASGVRDADLSSPVTSTALPFPGSRYPGEITDFDRLRDAYHGYQTPPRVRSTPNKAYPDMSGILPTFGMRRPETSFDANIEVGGRPGGWFTPEEYGRNYYKFGRGA